MRYFGSTIKDPNGVAALAKWVAEAAMRDLLAGVEPRDPAVKVTIRDLANRFLTEKLEAVECGELADSSFRASQARVRIRGRNFWSQSRGSCPDATRLCRLAAAANRPICPEHRRGFRSDDQNCVPVGIRF